MRIPRFRLEGKVAIVTGAGSSGRRRSYRQDWIGSKTSLSRLRTKSPASKAEAPIVDNSLDVFVQ